MREPPSNSPSPAAAPARAPLDVAVIGIGEDGWDGLAGPAREALEAADLVIGSARQLDFLPGALATRIREWPSPMGPMLDQLADAMRSRASVEGVEGVQGVPGSAARVALLASGSPMLHGLGGSLARRGAACRVIPHLSAFTLACARLNWPEEDVRLVSACGRPVEAVRAELRDGARLIVLSADGATPAELAAVLREMGCGASTLTVLERLGGLREARHERLADTLTDERFADLNLVAVTVKGEGVRLPPFGLADDLFEHDGQITRRDIRLTALVRLNPAPDELLWDIGAGAGSVSVEWCRMAPHARSLGAEKKRVRAERARANALRLQAPLARFVTLDLPDEMETFLRENPERPDAIFVGGGVSAPGFLNTLSALLAPGGRLVAHAVTLESEAVLLAAAKTHGGELTRLQTSTLHEVGDFTSLKPAMPVLQWFLEKPGGAPAAEEGK